MIARLLTMVVALILTISLGEKLYKYESKGKAIGDKGGENEEKIYLAAVELKDNKLIEEV